MFGIVIVSYFSLFTKKIDNDEVMLYQCIVLAIRSMPYLLMGSLLSSLPYMYMCVCMYVLMVSSG